METTIRTLCEQLNAQVALSEILAESNLETPTRFIRRMNNESRWTEVKKPIVQRVTYMREGFPIEVQIKAYERAIAMYKR
ncbi:hypothetical protein HZA97_04685 [Candidatus Woesearchaeota archaeon]|nr:hypothetical protein [Candidatus Woesearchaeota archaeon]